MKKVFLLVMIAAMLVNLCGCGDNNSQQTDLSSDDTEDNFYNIKMGETFEGISYSIIHYYGDEYACITG